MNENISSKLVEFKQAQADLVSASDKAQSLREQLSDAEEASSLAYRRLRGAERDFLDAVIEHG